MPKLTLFIIYDFAYEEMNDGDASDCAVHEIYAETAGDAVDVVFALREQGPDDAMFVTYLLRSETPKIDVDRHHAACDYGVRGTNIVVRQVKD